MTRLMSVLALVLPLVASVNAQESVGGSSLAPIRLASEKKAKSGGSEAGGEAPQGEIELVRVRPIIFQLPGPGGLRRSIGITLSLELGNARDREQVVSKLPKIKARIFEALTARPLVRSGNEIFDPEEIKRRVRHVSDNLFGEGIVSGVLIEAINEDLIR